MKNTFILLVLFSLSNIISSAQDSQQLIYSDYNSENFLESLESEEIEDLYLSEDLNYYLQYPINLNYSDKDELYELQLLTEIQIHNIFSHIEENGKLLSIYELQSVEGLNLETIARILPYVKVDEEGSNFSWQSIFDDPRQEYISRIQRTIEEQKGFVPDDNLVTSYMGSPLRYYNRYKIFNRNLSLGFTAEKDPGEELFNGTQNSFDFYSAHLFIKNLGNIKALAVGDYQLQFGQGLVTWTNFALGKSQDVLNIKRNALNIKPYTSTNENLFMRGAASTVKLGDFEISGFYSNHKVDGNIIVDTVSGVSYVSSFQTSGYHRTQNELSNKDAIKQLIYGTHAAYKKDNLNLGITYMNNQYSSDLLRSDEPYEYFDFTSGYNVNLGIDYSFLYNNCNFFGETAKSLNGGIATINGAIISLDPHLSAAVSVRYYEPSYQAVFANGFSETSVNNERGVYIALQAKLFSHSTLSGYYDNFSFPWLKYQLNAPSEGTEYFLKLSRTFSKGTEIYVSTKTKIMPENISLNEGIEYAGNTIQNKYRINFQYIISPSFTLRNRIELSAYQDLVMKDEKGFLIYQDVKYKNINRPLAISFRYVLFDTDSYDSRIYTYEDDMLYTVSIPSLYYKGSRVYLVLHYRFSNIDIWLRIAQSIYNDRDVVGSGLDEIAGNKKSELKAQVRFRF